MLRYTDSERDDANIKPQGPVFQGGEESGPPTLMVDAIIMGKEDSSSVLLYWDGSAWTSYWQGD